MNNVEAQTSPGITVEYLLVGVFLVILAFEKRVRKYFSNVRFRDREAHQVKYYEFDNLPGPSCYPIIGSLHHVTEYRNIFKMLYEYADRFGPIIRADIFHEKFVVLNNAPMAQILLQSSEMGHIIKTPLLYDMAVGKVIGNGLVTSKGNHWKMQRKLLNPAFSFRSFQNYTRLFFKYSTKLVSDLDDLFPNLGQGEIQPKPINSSIHLCGMQVISEAVMGLDFCNDEDGLKFYNCVRRVKELFGKRLENYILMIDFFWKLHPLSKEYNQAINTINKISQKIIRKYRLAKEEEDKVCNGQEAGSVREGEEVFKGKNMIEEMIGANMPDSDIMYEVNTMIVAGFDTTSSAVHYLMFLLALNPEHQKLSREEVDAIYEDPMKCQDGQLTFDAITDMKYVERCVLETLRIFPPVFAVFRKLGAPLIINETLTIPSGTNVVVPPLGLHKNPEYFPNPETFDPNRFLPENCRQRHSYAYIPFSSGPRVCIGTKFAMMQVKIMAAHIIRHFEIYTTDNITDVNLLPNVFLTPERDYNFILKKRHHT